MEIAATAPPDWTLSAANFILNGEIALLVMSFAFQLVPIWKSPWMVELAFAVGAATMTLIALELALAVGLFSPPLGFLLAAALVAYLAYWVPESHRLLVMEADAVIAAPPDKVFALATDPAAEPRLLPMISSVEAEAAGPLGVGSRHRMRAGLKFLRLQATDEIVEYAPPRRYAGRTVSGAPYNLTRLSFEPAPEGTRIHYEHVAALSLASAILGGGLNRGRVREQILKMRQEWFQALRRELEAAPL